MRNSFASYTNDVVIKHYSKWKQEHHQLQKQLLLSEQS